MERLVYSMYYIMYLVKFHQEKILNGTDLLFELMIQWPKIKSKDRDHFTVDLITRIVNILIYTNIK